MAKQTTDATKAAALYMLKNGLASYKKIAEVSGRSRQIIRIWGGKVDALKARKRYLQGVWNRANRSRRSSLGLTDEVSRCVQLIHTGSDP